MIADCWVMMFAWLVRVEAQRCEQRDRGPCGERLRTAFLAQERQDPGSVGDPTGPILVSVAGRAAIPGAAVAL